MKKMIFALILLLSVCIFSLSAEEEGEWYRTQVGSGIGNCGPASTAMAINWSTDYIVTVEEVRDYIGYTRPTGATDFMELTSAMRRWKVPYDIEIVNSLSGLKDLVDRTNLIAIVLIDTEGISHAAGDSFGRNYDINTGHYIVLNEVVSSYFLVQDPMPNGHDRRYHIEEVWNALKDQRIILVRNFD